MQSLANKVEAVKFDGFVMQDLISLGKMVDRVISIMNIPVNPLGDISGDHEGKIQNDIRKKLLEINPPVSETAKETEEDFDLDRLMEFPFDERTEHKVEDNFDFSEIDRQDPFDDKDEGDPFDVGNEIDFDIGDEIDFDMGDEVDFDTEALLAELNASLVELNQMSDSL